MKRDEIFISHRTTDSVVARMIRDFLVIAGIQNENIFCSFIPGNDVGEKIASEVKQHLGNRRLSFKFFLAITTNLKA